MNPLEEQLERLNNMENYDYLSIKINTIRKKDVFIDEISITTDGNNEIAKLKNQIEYVIIDNNREAMNKKQPMSAYAEIMGFFRLKEKENPLVCRGMGYFKDFLKQDLKDTYCTGFHTHPYIIIIK